jgi:integrase
MTISHLRLVVPGIEIQTVDKPKAKKPDRRRHLTPAEVDALVKAVKDNRNGSRDALMVQMAYRHGLRVAELVALEWSQVDFKAAELTVLRKKNGKRSTHPIQGDELRALRALRRENPHGQWLFMSEQDAPFTEDGFSKLVQRAGAKAGILIKVTPHTLRHACGYKLANEGKDTRSIQGYLGHVNIQNTVKYTELASTRFKDWKW